ncbi:MAG: hypothetical protein IJD77_00800 [Clostridia bacterium]|nr:hypothetical protein [Clostridia bacterium]
MENVRLIILLLGLSIFFFAIGVASWLGTKISGKRIYIFLFIVAVACWGGIGALLIDFSLTDFPKIVCELF